MNISVYNQTDIAFSIPDRSVWPAACLVLRTCLALWAVLAFGLSGASRCLAPVGRLSNGRAIAAVRWCDGAMVRRVSLFN